MSYRSHDSLWNRVIVVCNSMKTSNIFPQTFCKNASHLNLTKQVFVSRRYPFLTTLSNRHSYVLLVCIYKKHYSTLKTSLLPVLITMQFKHWKLRFYVFQELIENIFRKDESMQITAHLFLLLVCNYSRIKLRSN
jgi:hypothetical protein